jgi:hypothetical protein
MKRVFLSIAAAGLVLVGCGSSSKSPSSATAAPSATTTKASATTAAKATATTAAAAATTAAAGPATTAKPAAATTVASAAATTGAPAAAAGAAEVGLKEWAVTVAPELKAGATTLTVKNTGQNPHELKVIKGDSYASLPKASDGSVDEAKLGADVIGKMARINGGASGTLAVTLPAGKYVFLCNLGGGALNHASKGQNLDVTVA